MDFGYADDALYVHSALAGRKIDVLKRNPAVFFEVEMDHLVVLGDQPPALPPAASGASWARARRLPHRPGGASVAVDVLMSKFAPGPFTFDEALEPTAVIRIDIDSMTGKIHGF